MANHAARLLLALLLFGDYPDGREAAVDLTPAGTTDNSSSDDGFCFAPLALRYREEAKQKIASHLFTSVALHVHGRRVCAAWPASHLDRVAIIPLPSLDPVYAFMSLQR